MAFEYTVTTPDGATHVLRFKPLTELPIDILQRNPTNDGQLFATIEWALKARDVKIVDELPGTDLGDIMAAWQTNAGVTLGEFVASSR